MNYLAFEHSADDDGVTTLEALASTAADQHAAVMAEAQQVLDWAWRHFRARPRPGRRGLRLGRRPAGRRRARRLACGHAHADRLAGLRRGLHRGVRRAGE